MPPPRQSLRRSTRSQSISRCATASYSLQFLHVPSKQTRVAVLQAVSTLFRTRPWDRKLLPSIDAFRTPQLLLLVALAGAVATSAILNQSTVLKYHAWLLLQW